MQQQAPSLRIPTLDAMLLRWGERPTSAKDCGKLERKAWNSIFWCVFNPLLQIAWASGVLGTLFTKRKWSHHFKLAAADDIGLVIDDTAGAADGERGNPSHAQSHYLEGIPQ